MQGRCESRETLKARLLLQAVWSSVRSLRALPADFPLILVFPKHCCLCPASSCAQTCLPRVPPVQAFSPYRSFPLPFVFTVCVLLGCVARNSVFLLIFLSRILVLQGVLIDGKLDVRPTVCPHGSESQPDPGCIQNSGAREGILLLCAALQDPTWSTASTRGPQHSRDVDLLVGVQRKATAMI